MITKAPNKRLWIKVKIRKFEKDDLEDIQTCFSHKINNKNIQRY